MLYSNRTKNILKLYIYSNLHIALAGLCFLWGNAYLLGYPLSFSLSVYVFFATLFTYQLSRYALFKSKVFEAVEGDELYGFTQKYLKFTYLTLMVSLVIVGVLFFKMPGQVQKWSIILGVLSFLYPLKLSSKGKVFRLRDVPFLKIFIIAFVWTSTGVAFNYGFYHTEVDWKFFLIQFLFILMITLPFDIKDMDTDRITNVHTIPLFLGKKATQFIVLAGTIGYFILFFLEFPNISTFFLFLYAMLLLFLTTLTLTKISEMKKWQVMLVYDGSMIVFFLLTLLL